MAVNLDIDRLTALARVNHHLFDNFPDVADRGCPVVRVSGGEDRLRPMSDRLLYGPSQKNPEPGGELAVVQTSCLGRRRTGAIMLSDVGVARLYPRREVS